MITRRQKQVFEAMKAGGALWRYSDHGTGYLLSDRNEGEPEPVRRSTIDALIDAGLVEIDAQQSIFREGTGSDEVYKIVKPEESK